MYVRRSNRRIMIRAASDRVLRRERRLLRVLRPMLSMALIIAYMIAFNKVMDLITDKHSNFYNRLEVLI